MINYIKAFAAALAIYFTQSEYSKDIYIEWGTAWSVAKQNYINNLNQKQ